MGPGNRPERRGISRKFLNETGLAFANWRQMARLQKSRELLAEGQTVQKAAWSLAYENVSAFIAAFKRALGHTPGAKVNNTGPAGKNLDRLVLHGNKSTN